MGAHCGRTMQEGGKEGAAVPEEFTFINGVHPVTLCHPLSAYNQLRDVLAGRSTGSSRTQHLQDSYLLNLHTREHTLLL